MNYQPLNEEQDPMGAQGNNERIIINGVDVIQRLKEIFTEEHLKADREAIMKLRYCDSKTIKRALDALDLNKKLNG